MRLLQLLIVLSSLTASIFAADQIVMVGVDAGGTPTTTFTPNIVTAAMGDNVIFQFKSPTHTVSEATAKLANPCSSTGGFDSGVQPSGANFSVPINSTDSVYVFCATHCSFGMVMIINPGPNDSVATFQAVATGQEAAPSSSSGGSQTTSGVSSQTTTGSTGTTAPLSPTTNPYGNSPSSPGSKIQLFLGLPVVAAIAALFI